MDEVRARARTHIALRHMQIALHQRNEELETKVRAQTLESKESFDLHNLRNGEGL